MTKEQLIAEIKRIIKTNGNQEITGDLLQDVLVYMVGFTEKEIEDTLAQADVATKDKVRLNGYLLAGDNPVEVTIVNRLFKINIPINSRVSAKGVDYVIANTVEIQQNIDSPIYLYFDYKTESFGIYEVQYTALYETLDHVILGFITRLQNQTPLLNCAWWTFNGIEQRIKDYSNELSESKFLHSDSNFKLFPSGAILDFVQYSTAKTDPTAQYYLQYVYNTPTRYLIMVCNQYLTKVAVSYLPTSSLEGGVQWVDLINEDTGDLFARALVDPSKIPTAPVNYEKNFHLRIHPRTDTSLPFLFPDSIVSPTIRDSILEFRQLPTAVIESGRQYYLQYMYNAPTRFLLMVCDQNMNERARCFIDGSQLVGIQWVDLIDNTTKVPFARALIDPSKMPAYSLNYGKNFHLRLTPTHTDINISESIVWFGDSVMANQSTIPAKTGALLNISVEQCAVGGSRFSERNTPNEQEEKWHKLDMCILVDAIVSGDFTVQEEAAQWLANNVHSDFNYIVKMIERLKTIDFSKKTMVIFSFGTNDFSGDNLLGDNTSTDKKTVSGAINYVIEKLITKYPNLRAYFTTPTHRFFPSNTEQSSDEYHNNPKLYLIQYVDRIIEQANYLHYPALDMYRESGLNKYNHRRYFADGVHPNEVGNEYFSKIISAFINRQITL